MAQLTQSQRDRITKLVTIKEQLHTSLGELDAICPTTDISRLRQQINTEAIISLSQSIDAIQKMIKNIRNEENRS